MRTTHLCQSPAFVTPHPTADPAFVTMTSGLEEGVSEAISRNINKRDILDVVEERVDGVVPRIAEALNAGAVRCCGCTAVAVEDGAEAGTDLCEQLEETHD